MRRKLQAVAEQWRVEPCDMDKLTSLQAAVKVARSFPFETRLWEIQNSYYSVHLSRQSQNGIGSGATQGCESEDWNGAYRQLGEELGMRV